MGIMEGCYQGGKRRVFIGIAALLAAAALMAAVGVPGAEATQYFGKKPGEWSARILVRDNQIDAVHIVYPSSSREQKRPSKAVWKVGFGSSESLDLNIRRHGGFFRETYTRWSKQVFKGRLVGNRIRASLWFADRGDYVQFWSGTGSRPEWVEFTARKVSPRSGYGQP